MTEWTARVEWTVPTENTYTLDAIDQLMVRLSDWHTAVGRDPLPAGGDVETWTASLTVEANTLRQAIATAIEIVERTTGEKATGIEVIDADVHAVRVEQPSIPDLVGYAEIAEILGVSRQRAAQLADAAGFPVPVVVTKAGPLRVRTAVEAWAKAWPRKSGRPKVTADA